MSPTTAPPLQTRERLGTRGTATAATPAVTVNDINFGNVQVGATSTRTLTVTNTGNAPLNITTVGRASGDVNVFALSEQHLQPGDRRGRWQLHRSA